MEKTYVFNSEPSSGCCGGSRFDVTALLSNMMGGRGVDPNLLLALNNGARNQDAWGGNGMWWIWVILLFFLGGRNGFGFGNGSLPAELNGNTGRELLMNAIQGNGNAISQLASTLNCDVTSLQSSLCNIQSLIQGVGNQVGMSSQQIINSIQSIGCQVGNQLASCCCDLKTAIERQGFEGRLATIQQTNDIKEDASSKFNILGAKIDAQTQIINDKFCDLEKREMQRTIDALREQKQTLEFTASQQAQTANLINQLRPCPVPAYPSCSPYQALMGFGYGFGNRGCGCGDDFGCGCGGCR